jgi:hypothetical protein
MTRFRRVLPGLLFACALGNPAAAQQAPMGDMSQSPWLGWGPFQPGSVHTITAPRTWEWLSGLLSDPVPLGSFWTAGNPAALPGEVEGRSAQLAAGLSSETGAFRRPLDPGGVRGRTAAAMGWQPLGERGAIAGEVRHEEQLMDPGGPSIMAHPHTTSPFVMFDTTLTPHRVQRTRLQGAGGRDLGRVSVGASVGFEARNGHSTISRVPRLARSSRPAGTLGVEIPLGSDGSVRVGARARWATESETASIFAISGGTLVTLALGYAPPIESPFPPGAGVRYLRRDQEESGIGASVAGDRGRWSWAAHGERSALDEALRTEPQIDAPAHRWRADLTSAGIAVRRSADPDSPLAVVLRGEWTELNGDGAEASADSLVYDARVRRVAGVAELRFTPDPGTWGARGTAEFGQEWHEVGDPSPGLLRSSIEGRTIRFGGEVSHRPVDRLRVAAGYWLSLYSAGGSAPRPGALPRAIRPWAGGAMAHASTRSTGHAVTLGAEWGGVGRASLQALGSWSSVQDREGSTRLELQPAGTRSRWHVELKTVLR